MNTNLQAVAARISFPKEVSICCLYIPPSHNLKQKEIENLLEQLPTPFIIAADINGKHERWSRLKNDKNGNIINKILQEHHLEVLNNKDPTHFCSASGTFSEIDITIISPSIFSDFHWSVHNDLCSSDHYPILIRCLVDHPELHKSPKWKMNTADWKKYEYLLTATENLSSTCIEDMTKIIYEAAKHSIKKSGNKLKRPAVPWWSPEIQNLIRERRKVERTLKKHPENLKLFRLIRAKVKHQIKKAKKESWRKYTEKINITTPVSEIWSMIRKVDGKNTKPALSAIHDEETNQLETDPENIPNVLAKHFAQVSSSNNYTAKFKERKTKIEKDFTIPPTDNKQPYNNIFSIEELELALISCNGSSLGPDDLHYDMIKKLPLTQKEHLLMHYNHIWTTRSFPHSWRESLIIPILKPNKDPRYANNYRPISLTNVMCKIMEKTVNTRLTWFLESTNVIHQQQNGFRKGRSTENCLITMESAIQEAFNNKQHFVAISFDLEKAYDTAWRINIIKEAIKATIEGNMLHFLHNFMSERTFKVLVGCSKSDQHSLDNGIVQGGILSCNLFLLAINKFPKYVQSPVKCIGYADDWTIFMAHESMEVIQLNMQDSVDSLTKWTDQIGFRFSQNKTLMTHFCRLRLTKTPHLDPLISIHGVPIRNTTELRILGLTFDKRLSWENHITSTRLKVKKKLNLLRCLTNSNWGGDQDSMLTIYKMLILPTIEYGAIAYGSARPNNLKLLESLQNEGLYLELSSPQE